MALNLPKPRSFEAGAEFLYFVVAIILLWMSKLNLQNSLTNGRSKAIYDILLRLGVVFLSSGAILTVARMLYKYYDESGRSLRRIYRRVKVWYAIASILLLLVGMYYSMFVAELKHSAFLALASTAVLIKITTPQEFSFPKDTFAFGLLAIAFPILIFLAYYVDNNSNQRYVTMLNYLRMLLGTLSALYGIYRCNTVVEQIQEEDKILITLIAISVLLGVCVVATDAFKLFVSANRFKIPEAFKIVFSRMVPQSGRPEVVVTQT